MEFSPLAVMLLLISLIPVAHAKGSPKAVVSITPDTHVFIGEHVTLRCDVQGGGDTQWTYSWNKNNSRLYADGNRFYGGSTKFIIWSVRDSDRGNYTCSGQRSKSPSSEISDAVTLTVSEKPKPTVRENPQSSVYTGDTITLTCELQSTGWEFEWYKNNQLLQPLSTEQTYTLKVTDNNEGETEYKCRARRRNYNDYNTESYHYYYTEFSVPVRITVRERPGALLSVSPQSWLTEGDSVTISCEITDSSTDWTFSWYTAVPYRDGLTQIKNNHGYIMHVELLSDSSRGSGGNYTLSPAALKHTGVYMCRGERGEPALHTQYSNPQPLWITGESPPVSLIINPSRTQHFIKDSLSLSCEDQSDSTGWTVRRYTDSERVLDCSWWGSVTGSTCKISFLSTSYTGVYWCESESGENSNPVNITVYGSRASGGTVGVSVGLGFLFIALLILMILLWSYKRKKENQTSEQNQIRSGAEDSQSGLTPLQAGEAAAESREVTYAQVTQKKKTNRNNGADAEPGVTDVTYAEIELKPMKKAKRMKEKSSVGDDTVYSELKHSME